MTYPVPMHSLTIDERLEYRLRRGYPWLFAKHIDFGKQSPHNGDLVAIYGSKRKRALALGLYDAHSPIAVRLLGPPQPFSLEYLLSKVETALAYRQDLALQKTGCSGLRLLSGESEGLPGLIIDAYAGSWVVKVYASLWLPYLQELLEALCSRYFQKLAPERAQSLGGQPTRLILRFSREQRERYQAAGFREASLLIGEERPEEQAFSEHGLAFFAQVFKGQKTGFFLDQRQVRQVVRAATADKKVLDLFCYSGGFSLNAAFGGAREVWSVDADANALKLLDQHYQANAHLLGLEKFKRIYQRSDVFEWLNKAKDKGQRFDFIIADPPSFASSQKQIPNAEKAYHRLFKAAAACVQKRGQLLCCSCSSHIGEEKFEGLVKTSLQHQATSFEALKALPPDHVASFAEARYLKAWLVTLR